MAACVWGFYSPEPRPLSRPGSADSPTTLPTPVKVHLADGSTVIFRGARLTGTHVEALNAPGQRYAALATTATPQQRVPFDSVVGLEVFDDRLNAGRTFVVSTAATAIGGFGTLALLKALFGSCPTVYADTGAGAEVQAEGFSYAIAPTLEHRDLDALAVRAGPDGVVRLELRNEALETHYINHIGLVAVRHAAGARVVPDQHGRPLLVREAAPFAAATDRAGRDVRPLLRAADGRLFASDSVITAAARAGDLDDWIDLTATDLPPGDSVAVVLRLRNSLLSTALLYEVMLSGHGAAQWLGEELSNPATALTLARWYLGTMGLRAHQGGAGTAEHGPVAARLGDVGPIAFRDVALVLQRPAPNARSVLIRLRFVADNWRIDAATIAAVFERPPVDTLDIARVVTPRPSQGPGPADDGAARGALLRPDTRYLETRPGQRLSLEFADRRGDGREGTTYLIAWQGWYREWIRGAWLAASSQRRRFVPGDSAVADALDQWRRGRAELERAFYESRIPVR